MTKQEKKIRRKLKLEEKMKENRLSGKFKKLNLITGVLLGMFITISTYLVYNLYKLDGIENILRYIIMFLFSFLVIFLFIKYLKMRKKPLLSKYILYILLILVMGTVEYFIAYTINQGLKVVDNISLKNYKTYSTSLISLSSGNIHSVSDLTSSSKIGRVSNKSSVEGYKLTKNIIKNNNISESSIVDYDEPVSMLYDLYDGKIDALFISSNYVDTYSTTEKFEHIASETIELDKYSKKMKIQKDELTIASTKSIKEPFTLLLMGVDSTAENLADASGLGDSLMVITVNPNTLNVTLVSIPRDTFVPISCYRNVNSKITHAAVGGEKCMINTIQNFFDIEIDYFAKINFKGLIKLVDAMGGIDVEVPYSFCETDENRMLKNTIYVEKGMQHLNGVQALALSRNRKTYPTCGSKWNKGTRNDFVRGENQQLVIKAMMNKMKTIDSLSEFYALLDAVGTSMSTNMERKQILSFYNIFKNVLINSKDLQQGNDIISLQKMYLNGSGAYIKDGVMNMNLYEYVPSTQSLNAIINAMKVNLELKEEDPVYEFSFSADEEYESEVIGKNLSGGVKKYETLQEETEDTECSTNEELGADKKTCVCIHGYERNSSGVCEKKKISCTKPNEEIGADGVTCTCKYGYEKDITTGECVLKRTESDGDDNNSDNDSNNNNGGSTEIPGPTEGEDAEQEQGGDHSSPTENTP